MYDIHLSLLSLPPNKISKTTTTTKRGFLYSIDIENLEPLLLVRCHHHSRYHYHCKHIDMDSTYNDDDGHERDEKEEEQSFLSFLRTELRSDPLYPTYTEIFDVAPACILEWRRRFQHDHPEIWRRLFDKDKIIKEFVEAAPVLDAVIRYVNDSSDVDGSGGDDDNDHDSEDHKNASSSSSFPSYTIIDLACGKGYLSMILSEILPPTKINRIVLMDKAWPMRNQPVDPQRHINWEHIYGPAAAAAAAAVLPEPSSTRSDSFSTTTTENPAPILCQEVSVGNGSSPPPPPPFAAWPIRLDTSKQDLKASRQLANIHKRYLSDPNHPVIILAIHLCGTLSMKAVELFNGIRTDGGSRSTTTATDSNTDTHTDTNKDKNNVHLLALKPCCLPGMVHAKRKEMFKLGDHTFDSVEVCTHGKWKKNKWVGGPPRSHLKERFQKWSHHLYCGIRTTTTTTTISASTLGPIEQGKTEENENREQNSSDTKNISTVKDDGSSSTVVKMHTRVMVQHDGGFQNDFLFAERRPELRKRKRKKRMLDHHSHMGPPSEKNDFVDVETDMWQTLRARTDVIESTLS